jgi:hypothetical protein
MLKIAGVGVAAAVALLAVLSPVAFADDNTKEYEPQVCGNQPFEGLALGLLGHNAFEKSEKDENCNDRHKSDDGDDHKSHKHHD